MNARSFSMFVAGVAALIAVDATVASAQTTSTTRIPVTKEAPGEVVRVDTVMVHDTITTMGRVDTVTVAGPTITHYDTTTVSVMPAFLRDVGGVYFGLGAGVALPYGSIRTVNEPGFNGQAQLGWQGAGRALGLRADVNYTGYAENNQFAIYGGKPSVLTGNLDLRLNLPIFKALFGSFPHFSVYALGGGTYARFQALRFRAEDPATGESTVNPIQVATVDPSYESKFGWNAGGGLAWKFGSKELFVESRVIGFTPDRAAGTVDMAKHIPITLGFNWF
jgi:hypothetical protein